MKKKMESSLWSHKEHLKKELVERYFSEFVNMELCELDFGMVYKDKKVFKFLMFPKRIYRNYYLYILKVHFF